MARTMTKISITIATMREQQPKKARSSKHGSSEILLPPNTDLKTALSGFKNDGQFIAALHVSKNLGIPFDQLKATMLGTTPQLTATTAGSTTTGSTTTGSKPMSLGQAIHTLQPSLSEKDAQKEADTAENQAKVDIKITTAPKPVS